MERVLVLRLEASDCFAEAWLNGFCLLRANTGARCSALQVNEFVLEGDNCLALRLLPHAKAAAGAPWLAFSPAGARVQLLLGRPGRAVSDATSRVLAEFAVAVDEGEMFPSEPAEHSFELPVRFPRWRWLDAPPVDPIADYPRVTAFVQQMAVSLFRGECESFISTSRVRLEELAVAYQMRVADVADRMRSRLQLLHATKALRPVMPVLGEMQVRPCAGGRLLECLVADEPALRTTPDAEGVEHAWPIRVAMIEGRCHVFR
jgi:hypothetical protein